MLPNPSKDFTIGQVGEWEDMDPSQVVAVQDMLKYEFVNNKLLQEALTHGSYYNPCKPGISYERLEFLGDSALNCLMAKEMFEMYEELSPGALTRLRSVNVDTEKLARAALRHGLHLYLRHKVPNLDVQIEEFKDATILHPLHSNGLVDAPKVLADIVESILGAIFVDTNYCLQTVYQVFRRLADPLINIEILEEHPKARLYELCQKKRLTLKFVDTWEENSKVEVFINDKIAASATYGNKKEVAHNRAAKAALDNIALYIVD